MTVNNSTPTQTSAHDNFLICPEMIFGDKHLMDRLGGLSDWLVIFIDRGKGIFVRGQLADSIKYDNLSGTLTFTFSWVVDEIAPRQWQKRDNRELTIEINRMLENGTGNDQGWKFWDITGNNLFVAHPDNPKGPEWDEMKKIGTISLCTKCNTEELRFGKCPACDFFLRNEPERGKRPTGAVGEYVHEKCGFLIIGNKCTHCD